MILGIWSITNHIDHVSFWESGLSVIIVRDVPEHGMIGFSRMIILEASSIILKTRMMALDGQTSNTNISSPAGVHILSS